MKLKFLSHCHLQCICEPLTINFSWILISSFVRRVVSMKSRFAVKPFTLLKKDNREKRKLFTWQMNFVIYYCNQDMKQATKARMSRLHVVTVLNFPRATRTRRTGNVKLVQRKYLTKFISKLITETIQCLYNFEYLIY